MPNKKKQIKIADCPKDLALWYPGSWSRNTPEGTLLSREDWLKQEIEKWINHFKGNDVYNQTSQSNKQRYLLSFLKPLNPKKSTVIAALLEIETRMEEEKEGLRLEMTEENDIPRTEKEKIIQSMMEMSDEELFENNNSEIGVEVRNSRKYKQREKQYFLDRNDEELMNMYHRVPKRIKKAAELKERHESMAK